MPSAEAGKTAGAAAQRLENIFVSLEGSQDQHAHISQPGVAPDAPRSLQAIRLRHADVHQHYSRLVFEGELHGLTAGRGFANHIDVARASSSRLSSARLARSSSH